MSRKSLFGVAGIGIALLVAVIYFAAPHVRQEAAGSPTRVHYSDDNKPTPFVPAPPAPPPPSTPRVLPGEEPVGTMAAPQSLAESVRSLAGRPTARVQILNVKHDGPGCSGSLIFALDEFTFECQGRSSDTFRIARREVGQVHKNGVQALKQGSANKLGRKYHFTIAGRSRESVEDLFATWFNLAR